MRRNSKLLFLTVALLTVVAIGLTAFSLRITNASELNKSELVPEVTSSSESSNLDLVLLNSEPSTQSDGDGLTNYVEDANVDGDPTNDDMDEDTAPNYPDTDDDVDPVPTIEEGQSNDNEQLVEGKLELKLESNVAASSGEAIFKLADIYIENKQEGEELTEEEAIKEILGVMTTEGELEDAVVEAVTYKIPQENTKIEYEIEEILTENIKEDILGKIAHEAVQKNKLSEQSVGMLIEDILQEVNVDTQGLEEVMITEEPIAATPPSTQKNAVLDVELIGINGQAIQLDPSQFHFESGSILLVIEPQRSFQPGLYTLKITINNPITGDTEVLTQDFAWGILAMNTDKDIYNAGESGEIHIGVLDDSGMPVCDAVMQLKVYAPNGSLHILSTDNGLIENTGNCEILEVGNIIPDYRTTYVFEEGIGKYVFTLTADNGGGEKTISSHVTVFSEQDEPPFVVKRISATRNFPYGSTPMIIEVEFLKDYVGNITDVVPAGFEVNEISPSAVLSELEDVKTITWNGSWSAGNIAIFTYNYDAPDISPQFYTIGPLQSPDGLFMENRIWQIANDAVTRLNYINSNSYDVSTATHLGIGEEFSVNSEESTPTGFAFNDDGTKMFVIGSSGDSVVEYNLGTTYDVSSAVWAGIGEEFSVTAQESIPRNLVFNNDGLKMFIIGSSGDSVVEYDLGSAYDVSTAVYAGIGEEFSVGAQESTPTAVVFNNNGMKMFVLGSSDDAIVEYNLGAAYDVSTAVYSGAGEEFSVGAQESTPRDFVFNNNGTQMFVIGSIGDSVVEYTLGTAYDVSTAIYDGIGEEFSVGAQDITPRALTFNNDGTKLFVAGSDDDNIIEYAIATGDYSEVGANDGSVDNSGPLVIKLEGETFQDTDADDLLDVGSEVTINNVPTGLTPVMTLSNSDSAVTLTFMGAAINHQSVDDVSDLTFVFDDTAFSGGDASVVSNSGDSGAYSSNVGIDFVDNATLTYYGPIDVSAAVYGGIGEEFSVAAQETDVRDLAFNDDGTKMFVIGVFDGAVVEYTLGTAYDVSTAVYAGAVEEFSVTAQESTPDGLVFNNDGTKMFIIGPNDDAVVEYTLGGAYDVSTAVYAGIGEEFSVAAQEALPTSFVFNNDGMKMFVIGTTDDAVIEYILGAAYDVSTAVYAGVGEEFSVAMEETNPRDILFNHNGTQMFIIGYSGDDVVEYTLNTAYDVSTASYAGADEEFSVAAQDTIPHSLIFNNNGTKMFVLGNADDAVIEYDVDPGDYPEVVANDGGINNTVPLVIELNGDTFQDIDADDILDVGSEVTVNNVPVGLTPVMTLSSGDTKVTLTFTGNAIDHQDADDVADLTFIFDDTAFTSGDAGAIINSGDSGAYSSSVGIDFVDDPFVEFSTNSSDTESTRGNLPVILVNGTIVGVVTVSIIDFETGTAASAIDYTAIGSPEIVAIPAGTYDGTAGTSIAIPNLSIYDDTEVEGDETIDFTIGSVTGIARLGDADGDLAINATHTYTIINDDAAAATLGGGGLLPVRTRVLALDQGQDNLLADHEDAEKSCNYIFNDIKGHFSEKAVCILYNLGIVQGRGGKDGMELKRDPQNYMPDIADEEKTLKYEPDANVTRVEFLKILLLNGGLAVENVPDIVYLDMPKRSRIYTADAWMYKYVSYATSMDIIEGYEDGTFRPGEFITRAEALAMIARLYGGNDLTFMEADLKFTDVDISDWFATSVISGDKDGIIEGYEDGTFRPNTSLTRGESAVIIRRVFLLYN